MYDFLLVLYIYITIALSCFCVCVSGDRWTDIQTNGQTDRDGQHHRVKRPSGCLIICPRYVHVLASSALCGMLHDMLLVL